MTTPTSKPEIVEDGCGNAWARCHYADCDLHVVRPGKVQCNNCSVDALRAERTMLREPLELLAQAARAAGPGIPLTLTPDSPILEKLRELEEFGLLPSAPAEEACEYPQTELARTLQDLDRYDLPRSLKKEGST